MIFRRSGSTADPLASEFRHYVTGDVESVRIALVKSGSQILLCVKTTPEAATTEMIMAQNYMTHLMREYISKNKEFLRHFQRRIVDGEKRSPSILFRILSDAFASHLARSREKLTSRFKTYAKSPYRHEWFFPKNNEEAGTLLNSPDRGRHSALVVLGSGENAEAIDRDWVSEQVSYHIGILMAESFRSCSDIVVLSGACLDDQEVYGKAKRSGALLQIHERGDEGARLRHSGSISLWPPAPSSSDGKGLGNEI